MTPVLRLVYVSRFALYFTAAFFVLHNCNMTKAGSVFLSCGLEPPWLVCIVSLVCYSHSTLSCLIPQNYIFVSFNLQRKVRLIKMKQLVGVPSLEIATPGQKPIPQARTFLYRIQSRVTLYVGPLSLLRLIQDTLIKL